MFTCLFKWLLSGLVGLYGSFSHNMEATNICDLPPDQGPCRAIMTRYYYDPMTGNCDLFVYGGCAGNKNNFHTLDECVQICAGQQGLVSSNVDTHLPLQPLQDSLGTEIYGRSTESVCSFPPDAGFCRAAMIRYYYNPLDDMCATFIYGGCGGNGNQFLTLEECTGACKGRGSLGNIGMQENPDVIVKNIDVLPNADPMHSFSPVYPQPQHHLETYGSKPELCYLPLDSGQCRAIMESFYYNSMTGECEEFTYGGCGGNKNRFETLPECIERCKRG